MLPDPPSSSNSTTFIPLPRETTIFTSSHRTSLSLTTPKHHNNYPAHTPHPNISITSSDGTVYLTNQRIIYLPRPAPHSTITSNVPSFKSFSCGLLNLHDTHLVMPWFGPNAWTAVVETVPGGGLHSPGAGSAGIELRFTFKEGGAPEFTGKFEAIKERLREVVNVARQANGSERGSGGGGGANGVDLRNVHLEQLPRYEDSGGDRMAPDERTNREEEQEPVEAVPPNATADQVRAMAAVPATRRDEEAVRRRSREEEDESRGEVPVDAPPGYEEAQRESVQAEMEWRLQDGGRGRED
ncbi:hypothetical protein OHC33_000438 [Knufia fluminis]|uniref:Uncharacterized protein n=1 Tax=Knufia fluminis TaxID=191047 RepID=A0AAN8ICI2_9EURO|nr:hypothetical protein OHC33_000438 [Knufia fluminis]